MRGPGGYAFRSLVALIGLLGGGAFFGFFLYFQESGAGSASGFSFEMPKPLRGLRKMREVVEPVDTRPVVVVDAGHGGVDGGASGLGHLEKNLTLGMARQLGVELERLGIRAVQTREEDVMLSLEERTRVANRHPGAVFVSVHFNTSSAPEVHGLEVYHTSPKSLSALAGIKRRFEIDPGIRLRDDRNRLLAERIQEAVVEEVECRDRGVRNKSLRVTRESMIPSVLVECAYLTNETEARKVRSRAYRAKIARGIAEGVRAYLDAAKESGDRFYGLALEDPDTGKLVAYSERDGEEVESVE